MLPDCASSYLTADDEKRRLHSRIPATARLQLHWHDVRAGQRQVPARSVDISKFGVLVEVERSIPTGTLVAVCTTQGVVVGRGSIRHCRPKGLNYLVGLYLPNRMARAF
jgi:hypothetical protein